MEVDLTQGLVAIVDDDDQELVSGRTWCANKAGKTFYAYTYVRHPTRGGTLLLAMHRLILGLEYGDRKEGDHINGDGLDNRRANLRIVTHAQNRKNTRPITGQSRHKGVTFHKGKWQAQIVSDDKYHYLGRFDDETEAAKAHDAAAIRLHGEFARLNFPREENHVEGS